MLSGEEYFSDAKQIETVSGITGKPCAHNPSHLRRLNTTRHPPHAHSSSLPFPPPYPTPPQVMWKDETGEEIDTGLVRVLAVKQTAGGVKIAGIGGSGAGAGFGGGEKAEGDDDGGGDDGEEAEETK